MRRFFIISSALSFVFCVALLTHAASECEPAGPGSEPMDVHTETRLGRYLNSNNPPRTFQSTAEKQRWDWLFAKQRCERERIRQRKLSLSERNISERLQLRTSSATQERTMPVFDPNGPGSEPLATPEREQQIQRYAVNDNCSANVLTAVERMRCIYLVQQQYNLTAEAVAQRRISTRTLRISNQNVPLSRRSIQNGTAFTSAETGIIRATPERMLTVEFDPSGPGSTPLSAQDEKRLARYVDDQECPTQGPSAFLQRCRWLVQRDLFYEQQQLQRAYARLQKRGLLDGVVIRRSVNVKSSYDLRDAQSYIRATRLQGFQRVPRTVQEAETRFEEPVVVPGDCQVDKKLCN